MDKAQGQQGMTLVEVLVALALVTLVGSGLFSVYWTGNNAFEGQSSNSDVQYSARTAMQRIVKDALQAADYGENEAVKTLDEGRKLQLCIRGSRVTYYIDDDKNWLYRDEFSKPALPIAENISRVYFSGDTALLKIRVVAEVAGHSFTLDSSARPRVEISQDNGNDTGF